MVDKKEFSSINDPVEINSMHHDDYTPRNSTIMPHFSEEDDLDHHSDKKIASLRLMIPTYLDNQLTQIAASKRFTKRYLILKALSQAGYHIEKEDLVTDKRRTR